MSEIDKEQMDTTHTVVGNSKLPNKKEILTEVKKEESGFYEPYAGFSRNLRTWFLAYGIGAPALLLTQDKLLQSISSGSNLLFIACLFFGGVAIQIIIVMIYKFTMWCLYMGELDSKRKTSKMYKLADRVSEAFGFEFLFDLATLVLFVVATVLITRTITTGCGSAHIDSKIENTLKNRQECQHKHGCPWFKYGPGKPHITNQH